MKTVAAVLVGLGEPLTLAELEVPVLKSGQVLVEIAFSGVCHTQVLEWRGYRGHDRYIPHCLGHEGSGIVSEVGPAVTKVAPGDRVVLSWMKGSGGDPGGVVYRWGDKIVNAGPVTTFSRHSVISENRLSVLPPDISLRDGAMLGCAVPTGLGAVLNTARPVPGQSIAVFGTGGIGLCAVVGAALLNCTPLIGIDIQPEKLELARRVGATHLVDASRVDPVEEVAKICQGGVDFAVEASGRPEVMIQALSCVRNRGGTAVVIGNARHGERVAIDPKELNMGKRLLGTWGGDNWPDEDFPRYFKLAGSGKLHLDLIASSAYSLSMINQAILQLESGRVARPLVDMSLELD